MPTELFVIADDLSGAAETAAVLGPTALGAAARVVLAGGGRPPRVAPGLTVVDLDSRSATPADAARAVRDAIAAAPPGARIVKKIDSLLRGNLAAEIGALAAARPVVLALALPVAERTVRDGVVHLSGIPLHETNAWRIEPVPAPSSVAAALAPLRTTVLGLDAVRGDVAGALATALRQAPVVICDATTDADLDALAAAALARPDVVLAGSGGFAAAIGRHLVSGYARDGSRIRSRHSSVLVVVGSAAEIAARQVERLLADGAREIRLPLGGERLEPGVTVLRPAAVTGADPRVVVAELARAVADLDPGPDGADLVLTGGETARRVLDELGIDELEPLAQIGHGAVRSRTADGRHVVTRPGSFGGVDSLRDIVAELLPHPPEDQEGAMTITAGTASTDARPLVAVTMGDGAGVGPEVIVPAVVHPDTLARCRPVVIGDAARLRKAAGILGQHVEIVAIDEPAQAEFGANRINVIDLGLLPDDLPWGAVSPVAGEAAYQYIRVAAELAVAGAVQGICTAPLNKEALHAAGHRFPGHTELLAHLTGTEEVSMMLTTPKVKVIHVTTHIGLIDAVARIEPGLVERTVRRGHEALVRAGIAEPKIGVCGINPHAGENGLFGYGEEEEKIVPALKVLQADGIDARGPLPADTAFFLAGRGDYDLIVAMYHDQGHGPVKVLGIESGVNITVGLPVIRTSVDHGTAFDIAGKGVAEPGSMVEALRQAAELSSRPVA
ncbi:4-hydroxythreonine-4-phosphate dehydrogenase PdxA [Pseudonocardia sp. DSM 110487]|uniref:4-hydroxythreonine-4-phosphate dehydrogenase PdxA n=1 Tax=Pseudonocardia sp. DSM 110487 TaxID=2865833 RepID=UPI001C6A52D4|nr:4-hydroxythreonine-4-phosphate dehydrogenase PdxA [Pseudonocardia sp. DSM 110487]QYN38108.1 4-hydroxythreonine-4-phosphate dehydrogenase PdxA [Pseudonocardia sp. DSM 110487]